MGVISVGSEMEVGGGGIGIRELVYDIRGVVYRHIS